MTRGLIPMHDGNMDLRWQVRMGTAVPATQLLKAPASRTPCVHWRLRVTEVMPSNVFVHDLVSDEAFDVEFRDSPAFAAERVRIDGRHARLDALATLFGPGSSGAREVAHSFGFSGVVSVEEIVIRPGVPLEVDGVLLAPAAVTPYRGGPERTLEQVTLRVPGPLRRTQLLPWALGTSAVLLGVLGAAGALMRSFGTEPPARAFVDGVQPGELKEARPAHRLWR
ncbi:MAG: hypothetical protein KA712_21790 [Myxococcales bacterium]|nr:hypothetical protein [Myxococcales bacterium]